ncbi:hypothetical protein NDN01_21520 [Sphingomonas sp. QA11]|uniref:hypothetical protein n=1 Tax=Sphingomonas sp. QA11 TaxID=2950605 RepID=UPI00234AA3D4|nr:hypothetical protein [Sphingomonas sp. QA11]WCM26550.1 hypothetical protein NDN01_21520 [Sphingomonas sp. QA11]
MSLALAAMAAAIATHSVHIDHHGTPVEAVYSARTDIRTRTIGAHTPNRMDGRRCTWTATILVERRLANGPALTRPVPGERALSGNLPGPCARGSRAIEREVARHDGAVRAHLLAAAEQDRTALLAELDTVRNMASN